MIAMTDQDGQVFAGQQRYEIDQQHSEAAKGIFADRTEIIQGKHIHQEMIQLFMRKCARQETVVFLADGKRIIRNCHFIGIQLVCADHQKDQRINKDQQICEHNLIINHFDIREKSIIMGKLLYEKSKLEAAIAFKYRSLHS